MLREIEAALRRVRLQRIRIGKLERQAIKLNARFPAAAAPSLGAGQLQGGVPREVLDQVDLLLRAIRALALHLQNRKARV